MIAKFLPAWVATKTALVALVADRVEPFNSAQNEQRPRVLFTVISKNTVRALTGSVNLHQVRMQIDILATTASQAATLTQLVAGDATTSGLEGYSGTIAGLTIKNVQVVGLQDNSDSEAGQVEPLPRRTLDVLIWYEG